MTAPRLTIFTTCKPFRGKFRTLQTNALRSWARLSPTCDVVVIGDEPGVKECCDELGFQQVAEVPRSESGTPLLDGLVRVAERAARSDLLALVNADIMLTHDLLPAVEAVRTRFDRFLLIARRWNVDLDYEWKFVIDWEAELQHYAKTSGRLEAPYGGVDLFIFPRGTWQRLPPFAVGRNRWDSGLIYQARRAGIAVVDATDRVTCVHPNHDYSHHPGSTAGVYKGPEAVRNESLLGGPQFIFSALNATHVLGPSGVHRRRDVNPAYVLRKLATAPALYPTLRPLAPVVGYLAPWWRRMRRAVRRIASACELGNQRSDRFSKGHGYRFWVFGSSGVPEPAGAVERDGVNIIAAHRESDVMNHESFRSRSPINVGAQKRPRLRFSPAAIARLPALWRRLRARQSRWLDARRIERNLSTGRLPYPISVGPTPLYAASLRSGDGVECFDTPEAIELNKARIDHLRSLDLPIRGKRVIDVGCGVGHLAQFFVSQGCEVLCVDGRTENIERLGELYPGLKGRVFDLEKDSFEALGRFDVVFAYGLLYHLEDPFRALRGLASICDNLLLLETMVADHPLPLVRMAEETVMYNEALRNIGSRPTPSFVVLALRSAGFRHIYGPRTPPVHPDFDFAWTGDLSDSRDGHLLRCTFVASRTPLASSTIVDLLS